MKNIITYDEFYLGYLQTDLSLPLCIRVTEHFIYRILLLS